MGECKELVNAVDRNLAHHLRVYSNARWALERLQAPPEIISKFHPIEKKDTRTLPNISQSNTPGHRIKIFLGFGGSISMEILPKTFT